MGAGARVSRPLCSPRAPLISTAFRAARAVSEAPPAVRAGAVRRNAFMINAA